MTSRTPLALITYLVLIVSFSSFGQITPMASDTLNGVEQDTIASADLGLAGPVKYYAEDSTWIDVEHERIVLYGKAKVEYGSMVVEADVIQFYLSDYTARAYGKPDSTGKIVERVVFRDADIEFKEDSLGYNFKTRKGISYGARTQQGEAQLLASVSKKAGNDWISIGDGMLTTCNAENPHYHFRLKRAMVIPNEKVVSGPLYLQVRKVPLPLALPFGFFPNKKESTQGILLPGYGNGREKGFFVQNLGYYLPVNDYMDTKFLFDIYTRGSWAVRNVTNYKRNYRYNGSFNISRIVNRTGIPDLPNFSKSVNFNIQWTHNQDAKARPNSSFSSNVNLGSLNNFRNNLNTSQNDFLSSTFSSRIQWTKRWPDSPLNLGVIAGHTQNTQSRNVQVILPSVNLNMSRITLGRLAAQRPILQRALDNIGLTASADMSNTTSENEQLYRFDQLSELLSRSKNGLRMQAQASTSFRAKQFGTFTMNLNGNLVNAFRLLNATYLPSTDSLVIDTTFGFRSALNWSMSGSFNSRLYGTFQFGQSAWMKAMRHMLQWNVGMSYSPQANFTQELYAPNGDFIGYNPFDAAAYQPQNSAQQFNVNWSSTNNFEAKIRDKSSEKISYKKVKIIDSWRKTLSYNVLADSLNFSNLGMSAFTTIADFLSLNYNSTYSLYQRDSLGRDINRFGWQGGGQWLRMEGMNLALGFQLKSKQETTSSGSTASSNDQDLVNQHSDDLIDFNIPWRLNVRYNFRLDRNYSSILLRDTSVLTQAITFDGDITLFKYWAISIMSGYNMSGARYQDLSFRDFGLRDFTTTNIGVHWDLHCWELSVNYVPFGQRKSYMVQLNVKSALLQDLKLQKRGNLGDSRYLY
jgi:hypothetical protein